VVVGMSKTSILDSKYFWFIIYIILFGGFLYLLISLGKLSLSISIITLLILLLIIYIILAGGLSYLGIKLKSKGFFENMWFRLSQGIIFGTAEFLHFLLLLVCIGEDVELIVKLAVGAVVIIVGMIASGIAWGVMGWITLGITVGIAWIIILWSIGVILHGVEYMAGELIFVTILSIFGVVVSMRGWLTKGIIKTIAKSKYFKALEYLKNGNISKCSEYLCQSLYLLRNYNRDNKYINEDLAKKILLIKNDLETIQKADNYYKSKNYDEALKLYEQVISNNPDLKEILKERCDKIGELNSLFKKELDKGDELFKKGKLNEALKHYKELLKKYPSFKKTIELKIKRCKWKLKNQFTKELQKADNLFKNNEIDKALKEYERLLSLLTTSEYKEISDKYKESLKQKKKKCEEILKNPPIELFLEKAKKYESEGDAENSKDNLTKAIELWKMAVEQYKGGLKVAKLRGFEDIASRIESKISILIRKIVNTEIELLQKELRWKK
jgi:tetratricopeptide (TPR) repeat protein